MERRKFINNIGQVTAAVCTASFLAACSKSDDGMNNNGGNNGGNARLTANLATELTSVGSSKTSGSVIVVRTATGNTPSSFVALSLICTHQQCTVGYDASDNDFKCPCHGSEYSITGAVTQGPATNALTKYAVAISGNTLTVS
ncbi:MAG: Rieske (2Fe-2S) protein [Agriterribacter sp.]